MMGVFVQLNEDSPWAASRLHPVGYVICENGCWEWVGSIRPDGYGQWCHTAKKSVTAHRVVYERTKGPIPKGLHIDHLCRNRLCVNPDHLEAVTCRENILRGTSFSAKMAKLEVCQRGHSDWQSRGPRFPNQRQCRTCRQENDKARKLRRRLAVTEGR